MPPPRLCSTKRPRPFSGLVRTWPPSSTSHELSATRRRRRKSRRSLPGAAFLINRRRHRARSSVTGLGLSLLVEEDEVLLAGSADQRHGASGVDAGGAWLIRASVPAKTRVIAPLPRRTAVRLTEGQASRHSSSILPRPVEQPGATDAGSTLGRNATKVGLRTSDTPTPSPKAIVLAPYWPQLAAKRRFRARIRFSPPTGPPWQADVAPP